MRAFVNGETSVNEVIEIEAFDGVRKIMQTSAVPIRDTNERITGAVVVNEDISARKFLIVFSRRAWPERAWPPLDEHLRGAGQSRCAS